MKRFGLVCLLLIGALGIKAQNNSRRDSLLLDAMKNLKSPAKLCNIKTFLSPGQQIACLEKRRYLDTRIQIQ